MKLRVLIIIAALAIAWSGIAGASCQLSSARIGTTLVKVGDSERRVLEASQPDRTVQLETREGGAAGYRHDYYLQGVTVQVYIRGGRITTICRMRE